MTTNERFFVKAVQKAIVLLKQPFAIIKKTIKDRVYDHYAKRGSCKAYWRF